MVVHLKTALILLAWCVALCGGVSSWRPATEGKTSCPNRSLLRHFWPRLFVALCVALSGFVSSRLPPTSARVYSCGCLSVCLVGTTNLHLLHLRHRCLWVQGANPRRLIRWYSLCVKAYWHTRIPARTHKRQPTYTYTRTHGYVLVYTY